MRWIDVCGPPGVGKSALCDGAWPPRGIADDGLPLPLAWATFRVVVDRLLDRVRHHPTFNACQSMTARSFRKMAAVSRLDRPGVYVQTGFAQRGLGIGWRLDDPEDIRAYFDAMPVSLGVVLLTADATTVQARNVARGKDRSHMVRPMARPLAIAGEVLATRGVPVLTLDTGQPIEDSRELLRAFVASCAVSPGTARPRGEGALLSPSP